MYNFVFIFIACVALVLSLFVGVYALFRGQSHKKNYFLLMQIMIVVYLFGYLFEITSTNVEEAYLGIKMLDISGSFVAVLAFFFVADYCNVKLHPVFVRAPMLAPPVALALLLWSNKSHHLVYQDYSFFPNLTRYLDFTPGPLYFLTFVYPVFCMVLGMAVLIYRMKNRKTKNRKQLFILMICVLLPFIVDVTYYITLIASNNKLHIYFTPHSLALMSFFLYMGAVRYNILEIVSMGTMSAMEYIRDGFVLVDDENNYLFSNPAAVNMLPGIEKLVKEESIFAVDDWPEELAGLKGDTVEFSIGEKTPRYFRGSVSPVFADQTLIAKIILFGDITDSVLLRKKLENAAYIDALTGLYNRKHFLELAHINIERAQRLNQSIYMGMLDLDFFKRVNDTYGHAAGDLVLMNTAAIVRQTIRAYDLLGRYGGEEFILLVTDFNLPEARNLMERIRENIEDNTTNYEGIRIKITCSIGLSKFEDNDTLETSVKKADIALYDAKNAGRNNVKVHEFLNGV